MTHRLRLHLLLAATLLCACATLEVVPAERLNDQGFAIGTTPVAHIRGEVWGWYLFRYIPLIAGNIDHPSYPSIFSHTVRLEPVVEAVTRRAQELGATVTEVQSIDKSAWKPITLVLWLREIEVSANASRRP